MADQSDDELLQIGNLVDTCSSKMTTTSDFQRFLNAISINLKKISNNTNDLERLVQKIGTPEDSEPLRARCHHSQNEIKSLIQQTNKDLQQLQKTSPESNAEQRQRKVKIEQLSQQYLTTLKSFQNVQRIGLQKEKDSLDRAQAVSYQHQSTDDSRFADNFVPSNTQLQQQVVSMEQQVNMDDLKQRGEQLRKLETDIVEMNELFKDVDNLVHTHTDIIVSIAKAIESTEENTVYANQQLTGAITYKTAARRKKFIIIAVLIVLLLILGIGLYFGLKK